MTCRIDSRARWLVLIVFVLAASGLPRILPAQEAPQGTVVLTISGLDGGGNCPDGMCYDIAMLQALPSHEVVTETPWTSGAAAFRGPLLRTLLDHAGARGDTLRAHALNDYAVDIPRSDAADYDVILALARDGQPLTVRDGGPLWVIYPWGDHAGLRNELYYSRSIWQVRRIDMVAE